MVQRHSPFDLAEAFQLSQAAAALHRAGVLADLQTAQSVKQLAAKRCWNAMMLQGVLDYVAARTTLLRKAGTKFVTTKDYGGEALFLLDMYAGAYRRNAASLIELLRRPSRAGTVIDRASYARAFARVADGTLGVTPALVRRLAWTRVVDLGCGSAALLAALALQDPGFTGWGVDTSSSMCLAARKRVRGAALAKRVRIFRGDMRALDAVLPRAVRDAAEALTACNVVNELFANGTQAAEAWLRGLRRLFKGRPLLVADYYGRLGHGSGTPHTLLHDYAQVISGQGVPPASLTDWRRIYARAGCRLVHAIDDTSTTRFIHIVKL